MAVSCESGTAMVRPCHRISKSMSPEHASSDARPRTDGLNPADMANLDKAKINVWEFVEEVVQRFKVGQGVGKEITKPSEVASAA